MKLVVYGLSITSSWGNGHATTYRSLCRALSSLGHQVHFVEKDVEWYRSNRDLPDPDFCSVHLYTNWESDLTSLLYLSEDADAIVIGSYFPDAISLSFHLAERSAPPVFFYDIDTPITMAALRATGSTAYLSSDLIPTYTGYLSFTGGPILRELESTFGARQAHAFYCSVDSNLYQPTTPRNDFLCDLSYLGTYAVDRQSALRTLLNATAALLSGQSFLVAGPQYPASVTWQPNVRYTPHVPPNLHPAFYSSSRFTLNLTRKEMSLAGWSPSVRLFEASACGAAILSDTWPGLETFLSPGEEILLPVSSQDVAYILRTLSEGERVTIGSRARERVLAEHTSLHRARQFEAIVSASNKL